MKINSLTNCLNDNFSVPFCNREHNAFSYEALYKVVLDVSWLDQWELVQWKIRSKEITIKVVSPNEFKNNCYNITESSFPVVSRENKMKISVKNSGENYFIISHKFEYNSEDLDLATLSKRYSIKISLYNEDACIDSAEAQIKMIGAPLCDCCKKKREKRSELCTIQLENDGKLEYSYNNRNNDFYKIATIIFKNSKYGTLSQEDASYTLTFRNQIIKQGYLPCNTDNIAIFINMAELDLPYDDEERIAIAEDKRDIIISVTYSYMRCEGQNGDFQMIVCQESLKTTLPYHFSPDYNKLNVSIQDPKTRNYKKLVDGIPYKLPDVYIAPNGAIRTYNLKISNIAREGLNTEYGVHIYSVTTTLETPKEQLERLVGTNNKIHASWDGKQDFPNVGRVLYAPISGGSQCTPITIPIVFDFNELTDIRIVQNRRYINWEIKLCIEYTEDYPDAGKQDHHYFNVIISTKLHKPHWQIFHAIDFGTSAVAAYKYIRNTGNSQIIDLKKLKAQLLANNYPNDDQKKADESETADNLIASTIYVNRTPGKTEEYKNKELWFSPSTGMTAPDAQLPCIKYMVGHKYAPPIGKEDIEVKNVVHSVYKQLCDYYLNKDNASDIEGLLLTVPNTFTQIQKQQIKTIMLESIETLAEDHLMFVSESDAVLCSYLRNILNGRTANDEYVLIYDMGAGTLDITYAHCNYKTFKVEIIGRIGINKAGNYIDYLLGEIIIDILKTDAGPLSTSNVMNYRYHQNLNHKSMKKFRDYLRNIVKPALNSDINSPLPKLHDGTYKIVDNYPPIEKLGGIKIGDILQHKKFKEYIESCTECVISDFVKNYNRGGDRLRIDKIVLSGRTISLKVIQNALKESIKKHNTAENPKFEVSANPIDLKLNVVKGALDYMHYKCYSRYEIYHRTPLFGSYGILKMRNINTPIDWVELVSHRNDSGLFFSPIDVEIDCNGCMMVCLCHSFNFNPQETVVNGSESVRYDSTTILHTFNVLGGQESLNIHFQLDDNDNIVYRIDGNQYNLMLQDNYNDDNLRKSLWPIVY